MTPSPQSAEAQEREILADARVDRATVYVLNAKGYNRWWAFVQPGQDDEGRRISDEECRAVAAALAARASLPSAAASGDTWPAGLLDRIKAAEQRIADGHSPRRIPADPTDVDLVLAEVRHLIEGKAPPFWVRATPAPIGEASAVQEAEAAWPEYEMSCFIEAATGGRCSKPSTSLPVLYELLEAHIQSRIEEAEEDEAPTPAVEEAEAAIPRSTIHEWLERRMQAMGPAGITSARDFAEEVVRWTEKQHAAATPAVQEAEARDREKDRARFQDPEFNRWLDDSVTENGEFSVWHMVADTASAWDGWCAHRDFDESAVEGLVVPLDAAIDAVAFHGGSVEIEAAIRALAASSVPMASSAGEPVAKLHKELIGDIGFIVDEWRENGEVNADGAMQRIGSAIDDATLADMKDRNV